MVGLKEPECTMLLMRAHRLLVRITHRHMNARLVGKRVHAFQCSENIVNHFQCRRAIDNHKNKRCNGSIGCNISLENASKSYQ